jgi:nitroreductase
MDIIEIIKKRKSCRTYSHVALTPTDKKNLESFIIEDSKGIENEVVNFRIIEKIDVDKQMKLDYGIIKGHNAYILGTSKTSLASRVNYGYLMEKVVLKATEMNMSTCWIGVFDSTYFNEVFIEDGFEIPSIVIVGYSNDKPTYQDKFLRFSINASKRNSWDKLFFDYILKMPLNPEDVKKYSDSLEMVRLAPSSGNTQPWRVYFNDTTNEFHFFKKIISKRYELRGVHDIDMGIAMSHFELTSLQNGLSGGWLKYEQENINSIDDLQYIMTWKCSKMHAK